ncbi:hypothetical protein BDK51DRAFT_42569 [Blyttiomyces helicus]|uniref:Hydrophobin n=1 Tax=Blyttiomyces helicus TaxID=388810 RepID=A0A4P9W7H0_9FUNG|nr:hypothetical protein BDK51DRAFT_42569 [Blyttiomyces helicus]|eukprot:RKO88409.1 hypothetical protein BDK51DRAFT_42569 [Blyttiomyces helicus]
MRGKAKDTDVPELCLSVLFSATVAPGALLALTILLHFPPERYLTQLQAVRHDTVSSSNRLNLPGLPPRALYRRPLSVACSRSRRRLPGRAICLLLGVRLLCDKRRETCISDSLGVPLSVTSSAENDQRRVAILTRHKPTRQTRVFTRLTFHFPARQRWHLLPSPARPLSSLSSPPTSDPSLPLSQNNMGLATPIFFAVVVALSTPMALAQGSTLAPGSGSPLPSLRTQCVAAVAFFNTLGTSLPWNVSAEDPDPASPMCCSNATSFAALPLGVPAVGCTGIGTAAIYVSSLPPSGLVHCDRLVHDERSFRRVGRAGSANSDPIVPLAHGDEHKRRHHHPHDPHETADPRPQ